MESGESGEQGRGKRKRGLRDWLDSLLDECVSHVLELVIVVTVAIAIALLVRWRGL